MAFKARLSRRDAEYVMPEERDHKLSPLLPLPLYICFHTPDINQCSPLPSLQGNVKVNLGMPQASSTLTVVQVALCRPQRKQRQAHKGTSRSTILRTEGAVDYNDDNVDNDRDGNVDIDDAHYAMESMESCLEAEVEDSLALHLRSASFHNDLPALLTSEGDSPIERAAGREGAGAYEAPVGARPVCLLISTLNPSSPGLSAQNREEMLALQSSLFSYVMGMSNDLYVIVPETSVCDLLSAISITCCALSSPGEEAVV